MPPGCADLWGAQNMTKCVYQDMTDSSNSVPDLESVESVMSLAGIRASEYVLT